MKKKAICIFIVLAILISSIHLSAAASPSKSASEINRYSVILLDASPSMSAAAMEQMKAAARKFTSQVLDAEGKNFVSIIAYSQTAQLMCEFSESLSVINNAINKVDTIARNGTNTYAALLEAQKILSSTKLPLGSIKNVLLMTDGMANMQSATDDGPYTISDSSNYDTSNYSFRFANSVYNLAQSVKKIATIYTLGFFQDFDTFYGPSLRPFAKKVLIDAATSPGHYYEVVKADELLFAFGEIAESIVSKSGKFKYAGQIIQTHDSVATYYYDDAYFMKDSKIYNPQLATMSLCFELSTWSSHETNSWPNKSKNARELLTGESGLGFKQFEQNNYWNNPPTRDSIGVVAANKKITDANDKNRDYTLIALAIRGGGYGSEWASNFTMGSSGTHSGFTLARNNTLEFLKYYIQKYSISGDIKIWMTGFSRAAATANMVGGELNNGYYIPRVSLANKDLFVYTFAAPQGTLTHYASGYGSLYSNIHNIINLNDPVPLVAPFQWGFARFGNDMRLPTAYTSNTFASQRNAMLAEFRKLEGAIAEGYKIQESTLQQNLFVDRSSWLPGGEPLYRWEDSEVSQREVLVDSVDLFVRELLISRSHYYFNLQAGIREIFGIMNDGSGKMDAFIEEFTNRLKISTIIGFLSPMLSLNLKKSFDDRINEVGNKVHDFVRVNAREIAKEVEIDVTDLFIDTLANILRTLIISVATDVWNNDTNTLNLLLKAIDLVGSGSIPQAHYPEIYLAWMMSRDTNYNINADTKSTPGAYRVVRINCPVDVSVYDSENVLVAAIANDVSQNLDSSIVSIINSNEEKLIYLPGDEDYIIALKASDNGDMTFSTAEYDLAIGAATRLVNYYNVPLTKGATFTAAAAAFKQPEIENGIPNGSSAEYRLLDSSKSEVPGREELSGAEVKNSYYRVSVAADNDSGFTSGAGTFIKGSFARVEAMPLSGGEFLGWYVGDKLVSMDLVYRFAVVEDVDIFARFTPVELRELKLAFGAGGKVTSVEGFYPSGTKISITAEADAGYGFKEWTATHGSFDSSTESSAWFTMPDSDVVVTANFERRLASPTSAPESWANPFVDVSEADWFYEAVKFAHQNGLVAGTSATTFHPDVTLSRGMMATILWNHSGKPQTGTTAFADVADGEWYADAVNWAAASGIVAGYGDGDFGPSDEITREQMAVMLNNYAKHIDAELPEIRAGAFDDDAHISDWAIEAVGALYAAGILSGKGQNDFDPQGKATRAEVVAMMRNFLESAAL